MKRFGIVITATVLFSLLAASQAHAAPTPQLEWIRTYDSPNHGLDWGWEVVVDISGNVFVSGYETRDDLGPGGGENIWLRKYDTDGNTLWTQTYSSPAHSDDVGAGIAVDVEGNVYVTGWEERSDLGQSSNIWLRKYDTNGSTLWTRTYDSPNHLQDVGHGVATDADGNVYITGYEDRTDLL